MALLCRQTCPYARGTPSKPGLVCRDVCEIHGRLPSALQKYFGYQSFRPGQETAVLSVLHGHDTYVRMATGSGKSICMFLPALAHSDKACTVIISPLIALMDDQVSIHVAHHVMQPNNKCDC